MALAMEREHQQPTSAGSPCNDGPRAAVPPAFVSASSSSSPPSAAESGRSGCLSAPLASSARSASVDAAPNGQVWLQKRRRRYERVTWFDQQARRAKRGALLVAGLQILSRILGFFALTWATVVLLGAFASGLRRVDFYLVSALLLAEATRLFIIQIFSKLLSGVLFREESDPENFKFKDEQPSKTMQLDLLGQCLGVVLAVGSLSSTVVRLAVRHSHHLSGRKPHDDGFSNFPASLRIFYTLVILNSAFAILASFLRPFLRLWSRGTPVMRVLSCRWICNQIPTSQDSLTCYHDEVYRTAMEAGLPEADQLQVIDFAFHKIASDFKRGIRPLLVRDLNKDMIAYLYNNKHGIAMACKYLQGHDLWTQVAAANLPGFLVEEEDIEKQVALFWGLRENMYGEGKDATSAINSVLSLARKWSATETAAKWSSPSSPHPFLIDDPIASINIVDTLVALLLNPIRPTVVYQMRAFEACCRDARVLGYLYEGHAREMRNQRIDGESSPPSEQLSKESISASLQKLVVSKEHRRGKGAAVTTLGKLCMRLHRIVEGSDKHGIVTRIYASKALLSVLLHGCPAKGMPQEAKAALQKAVNEVIECGTDGEQRSNAYFATADVEAMEAVRWRLDLPAFEGWRGHWIEDLRGARLSPAQIDDLVNRARESGESFVVLVDEGEDSSDQSLEVT